MSPADVIVKFAPEDIQIVVEDIPETTLVIEESPKVMVIGTANVGPQGPPGAVGPDGDQGPAGPPGPTGAQGPTGAVGNATVWFTSNGQPDDAVGDANDLALDSNGNVYEKASQNGVAWRPANISLAGPPGSKWYAGNGAAPGDSSGAQYSAVVGDFYLDKVTGNYYSKGFSSWTLQGNLKGPQGPQGVAGPTGPTGPPGTGVSSILVAKGDLISALSAATPGILSLGANAKILTVDSSTPTGLVWKDTVDLAAAGLTIGADVNLYRVAANVLKTDDALQVAGQLTALAQLNPMGVVSLGASSYIYSGGAVQGSAFLITRITGDVNNRLTMTNEGKLLWGDGTAVADVTLYRLSPDVLKTDDSFNVNGTMLFNNTGFIQLNERASDPPAPGANSEYIYARDDGSGKTQLVVRFPTGAIIPLATEGVVPAAVVPPIPIALLDAKGDLVVASGADAAARLPVGTDGQTLVADAAQATGVKWATPAVVPNTPIFEYTFESGTTEPPSAGCIRFNDNSSPYSAIWMYVSKTDLNGRSIVPYIWDFYKGDFLYVVNPADPTKFWWGSSSIGTTYITDMGTYYKIGWSGNDGVALTAGTKMLFWWQRPRPVPISTYNAKGRIAVGSANQVATGVAVGTDGQVLTADAAQATGVKWATPAAGGGWTQIAEVLPNTDAINFSAIPATYKHLRLMLELRTWVSALSGEAYIRFNGDATATYDHTYDSYSAAGGAPSAQQAFAGTMGILGTIAGFNARAGRFTPLEIIIPSYAIAGRERTYVVNQGFAFDAAIAMYRGIGGAWRNTAAITAIEIRHNSGNTWASGTRATLYGTI